MPAFVAHFLIAKSVFPQAALPKETLGSFLLGSVGPDLPYYRNVFGSAVGEFFEEKFNVDSPGIYTGYGDYFHARTPNIFPMKLLETIKKDKDPATQDLKLAYALGYLTHVAADQHIHPFVEQYAGPYYVSGAHRKRHRTIEVYEDILLYDKTVPGDFNKEDFPSWFDISEETKEERPTVGPTGYPGTETVTTTVVTPAWFGSTIQRSFLESYSVLLDGDEAEKWVKGFRSIFKFLNGVGPYHDALVNLGNGSSPEGQEMRDWFNGAKDYLTTCFEPAKELASDYVSAGISFFKAARVTDQERNAFLTTVGNADLTAPLLGV
jgi:hypothetical protein